MSKSDENTTPRDRAWLAYRRKGATLGERSAFEAGWKAALLSLVDPESPGRTVQDNKPQGVYEDQIAGVEGWRSDVLHGNTERRYPCAHPGCEVMRTKAEGGTTVTMCEEHWDENWRKEHP
jgi:hypothetical protein